MTSQNKKIKILLLISEERFTHFIRLLLQSLGYEAIETAGSADPGLLLFEAFQPDLCILSIHLENKPVSGIQLAKKIRIRSANIPIIFLSEHYTEEEYLLCRPLMPGNFLGRELSRLKLLQALDAALSMTYSHRKIVPSHQIHPALQHFFFKVGDEYKAIAIAKILYFYAAEKHTYARVGERNYPCNVQLKVLAEMLRGTFIRIHKTYLVNIDQIDAIQPNTEIELINSQKLPIGYAYRRSLTEQLIFLR